MRVLSLFSGIGAHDLGLEMAGCEIVGKVSMGGMAMRTIKAYRAVRFDDHNGRTYFACDTSWEPRHVQKWKQQAIDNNCYNVRIVRVSIRELPRKGGKK